MSGCIQAQPQAGERAGGSGGGGSHEGVGAKIHIEKRPLGAFHQDGLPGFHGCMQFDGNIRHVGFEAFGKLAIFGGDGCRVQLGAPSIFKVRLVSAT